MNGDLSAWQRLVLVKGPVQQPKQAAASMSSRIGALTPRHGARWSHVTDQPAAPRTEPDAEPAPSAWQRLTRWLRR